MQVSVTMQSADDQQVSIHSGVVPNATTMPGSTDAILLRASETGSATSASDCTSIISRSEPGAVGVSTHTGSFTGALASKSISMGVRAG